MLVAGVDSSVPRADAKDSAGVRPTTVEVTDGRAPPAPRQDAATILLLHGFPSSSRMWQPLLDRLADRFHLVAPDYPGFGHSHAPSHTEFAYTFDHLAAVVGDFELSRMAGLASQTPASSPGCMGPLRPLVPGRGSPT
jgi:alpha-beta hydrolase superfamily lysophospholipase